MDTPEEQIDAILSGNAFAWATSRLRPGTSIDDVRFRDLISVTEEKVYDHIVAHGFRAGVVSEGGPADEQLCIARGDGGSWSVYYAERGQRAGETTHASRDEARREVVRRLMVSARIALNHRYRLAHPDEDLPRPSQMD